MNGLSLETGTAQELLEVVGMEHLAVAVGNGCEIERSHSEAEGGRFETLTIPERLHDVEATIRIHDAGSTREDADDLVLGEAVEELAHPNGIIMPVGGEWRSLVE